MIIAMAELIDNIHCLRLDYPHFGFCVCFHLQSCGVGLALSNVTTTKRFPFLTSVCIWSQIQLPKGCGYLTLIVLMWRIG